MGKAEKCQEFTALGEVVDNDIYTFQVSEDFCPSRRKIEFLQTHDVSILPLISNLDFIQNKQSWGYPFRFGFFEIMKHDFDLIAQHMLQR